jgi:hypothetical protein
MPLFWTDLAPSRSTDSIHPVLTSFADEICKTVAQIFAYVGTLAVLAILGIQAWDQLQAVDIDEPSAKAAWSAADRSYPALAISKQDKDEKSATYTILGHPAGGRRDILRWAEGDLKPPAELKRGKSAGASTAEGAADWVSGNENPQLRGAF